jgi:hypothetical protein
MITYTNAKGELVRAIPLETEDTKYLFKISVALQNKVDRYLDDLDAVPAVVPADPELDEEEDDESDDAPAEAEDLEE